MVTVRELSENGWYSSENVVKSGLLAIEIRFEVVVRNRF